MSLPDETVKWLEDFFQLWKENGDKAQEAGVVSNKSASFANEQAIRFKEYGERMYLSQKQRDWLESIKENL